MRQMRILKLRKSVHNSIFVKEMIAIKHVLCYIDNRPTKKYKASYNLHYCNLKEIFLVLKCAINVVTYPICMMNVHKN